MINDKINFVLLYSKNEDGMSKLNNNNYEGNIYLKSGYQKSMLKKEYIDEMHMEIINNSVLESKFEEIEALFPSKQAVNNITEDKEIMETTKEKNRDTRVEKNQVIDFSLTAKTLKKQSNAQFSHLTKVKNKNKNNKLIKYQNNCTSRSKNDSRINSIIHESQGEDEGYNNNKNKIELEKNNKPNRSASPLVNTFELNNNTLLLTTTSKNNSMDKAFLKVITIESNLINAKMKVNQSLINNNRNKENLNISRYVKPDNKLKMAQNKGDKSTHNLYQTNTIQNEKFSKLQKELKEKEEQIFKQECTFHPKVNKNNEDMNDKLFGNYYDFTLRQKLWLDKAKERLDNKKEMLYNIEKTNCTFQPRISGKIPQYQDQHIKGAKAYYERINRMNKLNDEKKAKSNPNYNL